MSQGQGTETDPELPEDMLSWRPEERPADPRVAYYWAGIARKP